MHEAVSGSELPGGGGSGKLLVLFSVAALLLALHLVVPRSFHGWGDPRGMAELLERGGLGGGTGFVVMVSVLTFAGLPRLVFFGLGGLLLGFTEGFALALVGSLIGSTANFALLRWGGRDWLAARYGTKKYIGRITGMEPTAFSVFMARQLPVSNVIINAGLAMSRVGELEFMVGSLLGFIPQGAAVALIGSGGGKDSVPQGALQWGGVAVVLFTAGLCAWYARSRKNRLLLEVER